MTKEELQKLSESLTAEIKEIDKELSDIASENPMVKGDFDVKVQDIGTSPDDTAQEAGELDRLQALVDTLETRRKDISNTLEKIKSGAYGKCEVCLSDINPERLRAISVAALCMNCAQKRRF